MSAAAAGATTAITVSSADGRQRTLHMVEVQLFLAHGRSFASPICRIVQANTLEVATAWLLIAPPGISIGTIVSCGMRLIIDETAGREWLIGSHCSLTFFQWCAFRHNVLSCGGRVARVVEFMNDGFVGDDPKDK